MTGYSKKINFVERGIELMNKEIYHQIELQKELDRIEKRQDWESETINIILYELEDIYFNI